MNVTTTVLALVKSLIVHAVPETASQSVHPPKEDPGFGVAVIVTDVPEAKAALQLLAQLSPAGALLIVPDPVPMKSTARGMPVKQTTVPVMYPVTSAPCEDILPVLEFVVTVAETSALPQASPVATSSPVGVTVAILVVFEAHVTWLVMSLVTGGWI